MALRVSLSQDPKSGTFCQKNSRIFKVWKLSEKELKMKSLKTVLVEFVRFISAMLRKSIPFVQVLHNGRMHWVATSTFGCNQDESYLKDSLFNGRIAEHTKKQICSIVQLRRSKWMFYQYNNSQVVLTVWFMLLDFAFISWAKEKTQ